MWTVDHLADIESDFSVFHRVDDPLTLSGPEFFRKAHRLGAYTGVLAARIAAQESGSQPSRSTSSRGREQTSEVSLNQMRAQFPDVIEMG